MTPEPKPMCSCGGRHDFDFHTKEVCGTKQFLVHQAAFWDVFVQMTQVPDLKTRKEKAQ